MKAWTDEECEDFVRDVLEGTGKTLHDLVRAAVEKARRESLDLIKARLVYDDYQQPRFTWHDVQDVIAILARSEVPRG